MEGNPMKQLSNEIQLNFKWYNHQAPFFGQKLLSDAYVKYALQIPMPVWQQIKQASQTVPPDVYEQVLKDLHKTEMSTLHQTMPRALIKKRHLQYSKRTPKAFNKAQQNMQDLLNKVGMKKSKPVHKKHEVHHSQEFMLIYRFCVKYVVHHMRSVYELNQKINLKFNQPSQKMIDAVTTKLEKEHLAGDQRYADLYVQDASKGHHKGAAKIKGYLHFKHISDEIIESAIQKYYPLSKQKAVAESIARTEFRLKAAQPFNKRLMQIQYMLTSKGFSYSIAYEAIEDCNFKPDVYQQNKLLNIKAKRAYRRYNHTTRSPFKLKRKMISYLYRQGFKDYDSISTIIDKYTKG